MSDADTTLRDLARAHGVHLGFADLHGAYHEAGPETLRALLGGLGIDARSERSVTEALADQRAMETARQVPDEVIVVEGKPAQMRVRAPCDWQLETEMGDAAGVGRAEVPEQVLACIGTHDTPTLRGFWYGRDIETWHRMGWVSGGARDARHMARAQQRDSMRRLCGIASDAPARTIADRVQSELARSPADPVSNQLEDALGLVEAQNLPGTTNEHPNWRRRLPLAVEEFAASPDLLHAATLMPADRKQPRKQDRTA